MTRTERAHQDTRKSNSANAGGSSSSRQSQISRSLSKLLRHQAENERIPISSAGWVRLDDLLRWRGLERVGKGITLAEIFDVVEEDGRVGKGRFGVRYIDDDAGVDDRDDNDDRTEAESDPARQEQILVEGSVNVDGTATGDMVEMASHLSIDSSGIEQQQQTTLQSPLKTTSISTSPTDPASKNTPETQRALHHYSLNPKTDPSLYLIRATQGHSIKAVASTDLLTPITLSTLSNPSNNIPTTVVHGTFYGAWPLILATGGLKPMSRNNVHFATGPSLDEVLDLVTPPADPNHERNDDGVSTSKPQRRAPLDQILSHNTVISGMRRDAQILVFIDLKRCLEDAQSGKIQMNWFVSGNGVVLTEGVIINSSNDEDRDKTRSTMLKMVPIEYFAAVVEIKNGLGVLWKHSQGVVRDLPDNFRNLAVPRGKGGLRHRPGST